MRRHIRTVLLVVGACIVLGCLVAVGVRLFAHYVRGRVESVIESADLAESILPATVPFRQVNRWVIVECTINNSGDSYNFIVDTGAEATCLLKSTFEELGLSPVSVGGIAIGDEHQSVVLLDSLRVGDTTYTRVGAVAVDEETLDPISCLVDGGIIGINVLSKADLHIDYDSKTLTIGRTSRYSYPSDTMVEIPLVRDEHRGLARVAFNTGGGAAIRVLLDTGYSGLIKLTVPEFSSFFDSSSIDGGRRCWSGPPVGSRAIDQSFPRECRVVRLRESSLGSIPLGDLPITLELASEEESGGLLGNHFLEQYHVTVDWDAGHLRLESKAGGQLPRDIDVLGLTYRPSNGKLVVDRVYDCSEAAEVGIEPGDEIIVLDGKRIEGLSTQDLCLLWPGEPASGSPAADSLRITILHDHKEQTLHLSRFSVFGS
jgi:predicted aspartyl protease